MLTSSLHASEEAAGPKSRRSSLQVRKQQLVRDAIWDAAIDLFTQKGFEETTVDDIVEAAGVSRRSFFRYFSSKGDLMTQRGTVSYETLLTEAIQSCPPSCSISEALRHTVLQVARQSAAEPRTRKIMQIAAKYPGAQAALSRVAEVHEPLASAFAHRYRKAAKDPMTPNVLAALTLSILNATFRSWFVNAGQDISTTVDQVFETVGRLVCEDNKLSNHQHNEPSASNHKTNRSRR